MNDLEIQSWKIVDEPWGTLYRQDCRLVLPSIASDSLDSMVTDPPAGIDFMGKGWDNPETYGDALPDGVMDERLADRQRFVGFMESVLRECFRVLKPGAHGVVWALPRTSHWTATALENVGFEIRDCIYHVKPRSPEVLSFLSSLSVEQWELLQRCAPTDEFLLHVFGCLSEDTEILTEEGWVPYQKCAAGKRAVCYDLARDTFSWQPIEDVFIYPYQDTAFRLRGDHTDQIVSRNHRCLVERGGATVFEYAEKLGMHETVPVLESVSSLLEALPLSSLRGNASEDMLSGVQSSKTQEAAAQVPVLRAGVQTEVEDRSWEGEALHVQVCGSSASATARRDRADANDRSAGTLWVDGGESRLLHPEDVRTPESGMEGRGDVHLQAWELRFGAVCALSSRVLTHGPEGRVCDGAPAAGGASDGSLPREAGGGASRQSRSDGQPRREFDGLRVEPGPQTVRASRFTRSDLVRVEPVQYSGVVWCVKTPTGAFVARRAGKAFVTGNSGFPKSLDVSKALDKMAGAAREVVGTYRVGGNALTPTSAKGGTYGVGVPNSPPGELSITAPATEEAKLWAGWGTALKPAVEVWWVARKPIREANVATQVRKTGTGAINIDGCRVEGVAEKPGGKIRTSRSPQPTHDVVEEGSGMKDAPDPHPGGRWPAHVLFTHSPLCKRTGTHIVKGHPQGPERFQKTSGGSFSRAYANQQALAADEEHDTWSCAPDCPVRQLNEQSGETTSGAMNVEVPAYEGESVTGMLRGRSGPSNQHGDSGGASRFFKTFEHESDGVKGRWPSHLLLSHAPGCRRAGTKSVRTGNHVGENIPGVEKNAHGKYSSMPELGTNRGYANEDGIETVAAWVCTSECPVRQLDEQSFEGGIHSAGNKNPSVRRTFSHDDIIYGKMGPITNNPDYHGDSGGASRFFQTLDHEPPFIYVAKASRSERDAGIISEPKTRRAVQYGDKKQRQCNVCGSKTGPHKEGQSWPTCGHEDWRWVEQLEEGHKGGNAKNTHPTVKSLKLMSYLVRLVTRKGGTVLDPFSGSGSTLVAALMEGAHFVGIEREDEYALIAAERVRYTAEKELGRQQEEKTFNLLAELEQEF